MWAADMLALHCVCPLFALPRALRELNPQAGATERRRPEGGHMDQVWYEQLPDGMHDVLVGPQGGLFLAGFDSLRRICLVLYAPPFGQPVCSRWRGLGLGSAYAGRVRVRVCSRWYLP